MTTYTTTVVSATTIFDFDTEATNLLITSSGGLHGTASADVVVGTEDYSRVTVNGELTSDSANCMDLQGNYSTISIGQSGNVSSNGVAMNLGGDGYLVNNFGHISGAWGITSYGGSGTINNAGSIVGTSTGDYYYYEAGVYLIDTDDDAVNSAYNVVNSGTISGNDYAIYAGEYSFSTYFASDTTVVNSGLLLGGGSGSVYLGLGNDTMINSGVANGDVKMGGDTDLFDGRGGTVNGTVFGESGDDTYIIDDATINLSEDAAQGTDTVQSTVGWTLGDNFENLTLIGSDHIDGYGNVESNTITGNQGNNVLNGLGSADTLYGGAGDDKVNGGNGIDNLFGGDGDDRLRGQKGADIMKSEAGDDGLYGGEGNDNLFGGDDNDILKGGMGRDKLYGGDDADVFLYTKAAHSKNDATADKIQDFELGLDTIDLSGVAAGTLTFIAGAAFSGTQGEVQVTGATNSTVLVDVDGDGTADMKISVIGVTGLSEGDFVL
ncbi:MAG: calcium-binding protein [Rhodobacteraceae bacterium]|nr:calcium-binding protein [Paracoccaceae bacterium]